MKKNCNCSCNSDELYFNNVSNIDRVIENILNELNNFKVYSDEAEIIVNSEKERVLAETKRIKAETQRLQNELERIENENKRKSSNKNYIENENQRNEKFKEIEQKISEIEKAENDRKDNYNNWNKKIESFNKLSDTMNEKISEINKTIEKIEKLENSTTEDKDKLYTLIDKVEQNISDIQNTTNEIKSIKSQNENSINELRTSIEDIKKNITSNEKLTTIEKDIKSLKDKDIEYDSKFTTNDINLKDLRDKDTELENKIKTADVEIKSINTKSTDNKSSIDTINTKLKNVESSLSKILESSSTDTNIDITQFNLLKSKVENNEENLSTITSKISDIENKITLSSENIDKIKKDITDKETLLNNKISTTNSSLSSLSDKVNSNQKSLDEKANKTDLDKKANKEHKHNISDITNLQSELDKKSNLIDLGSVNLIKNSDDLNSWVKYDGGNHIITKEFMNEFKIDGQRIKSDGANGTDFIKSYIDLNVENLIVGKTYTFSIYVKNNRDVKAQIRVQGFDWNFMYELQAKEYKRFIVTGKRAKVDGVWENKIQFQLRSTDKSQYVDMTVSRPQLEEGNTVTSWSKNPNDYKDYKDELNNLNIKIDNFKRTVLWEYNYSKSTFSAGSFGFNYDNYIDLDKKYGDTIFTTSNSNSNITIDKSKVSNFDKNSERLLVINDDDGKYRIVQDILQAEGKMLYRAKVEDELSDSFYVSKLEQLSRLY